MAKPTAKQRREWQERVTAMPTAADIANCIECWPTDWQDKYAFHNGQVATLLAEVDLLRAREAALAEALPFLRELAKAHISMLDEDDAIIKVSPGRAAWVISRCQACLRQLGEEGERHGG